MISVLILTYNEEVPLPGCLESVAWCDDVVVFDSRSEDRTVDLARAAGARVFQRTFDGYASQRNAALSGVEFRHPWVLMVDADERVSPELEEELRSTIPRLPEEVTLLRLRRKDMFLGRWLRRSSGYPTWFGRIAKVGHVRVEREINEEYHTDGEVERLRSHLVHYPFVKGVTHWLERHVRYARMEAERQLQESGPLSPGDLFSRDPVLRRRALKRLAYRIPFRPVVVFWYLYLVRLGFLDGRPGYLYCRMRSTYESMIDYFKAEALAGRRPPRGAG